MDKYYKFCAIIFFSLINRCLSEISVTLPYGDTSYNFSLTALQRQVFENVPVWTIESGTDGNIKYINEGAAELDGNIFEDISLKAILLKKNNCNTECWEGVFGFGTTRHVINSSPKLTRNAVKIPKYGGTYISHLVNISRKIKRLNNSNSLSNEFYAKIVVVVDGTLYKKLGSDVNKVSRYMSIFWSAVDLQYRNITLPHIEVRITGLIIAKDDKALNCVSRSSGDYLNVNIDGILHECRNDRDFIKNTNINTYDAAIIMTGLTGFLYISGQQIESNGASFNGSICSEDYNFSVITDDGSYFGIHSAIHELGHLLGLDHDAVPGNAFECFPTERNSLTVMWPRNEDRELEFWSQCSIKALQIFTEDQGESWCLRELVHQQF